MNTKCDFCGSENYEEVYKPIGTKRNNRVCICQDCGLVFSIHDDVPYSREPNISGDADWGNVRFCKGQRFDAVKDMIDITKCKRILDVGSSRGHFVRWAREQNPTAYIMPIEPDERVVDDYADFGVYCKKLEQVDLQKNYYDFVYCMQTLEHVDSASAMLKQIYDCLAPDGVLFLEVPNIEVIKYEQNIEEFFIDKHNFHFSRDVLCKYMESIGYYLEDVNNDELNVRIKAVKSTKRSPYGYKSINAKKLIENYAANIQRNRAKIPAVVEKINRILDTDMKVAFWGANTMFDLMVKYGGLEPKRVDCLVDSYIHGLVKEIHGVEVGSLKDLKLYQPDVCIVLARFSAPEIMKKAVKMGIRNVVLFQDLMK